MTRSRSALPATLLCLLVGCADSPTEPAVEIPAPGPEASKGVRYLARQELDVGGYPAGVELGDLNADGLADLVVTFERPGGMAIWIGSPEGLRQAPAIHADAGWTIGPLIADDGDQHSAIAASAQTGELLIGAADQDPARLPLGGTPRAMGAGPLGGLPTIVAACDDGRLTLVRPGRAPRTVAVEAARFTAVHVTEEGTALWVAQQSPPRLVRYTATDLESEAATPSVSIDLTGIPRALVETDVDGDGDAELVCYGGDEDLWIFGLNASGGSTDWRKEGLRRFRAPGLVPLDVVAVDLDGDGREELISVHGYDTSYGVLGSYDVSTGHFALRDSEYAGQTPVALAVGDTDGDGRPDLVVANRDARRVSILPGTGLARSGKAVFNEARRTPVGDNPLSVAVGDLDGDGMPEAVSADGSAAGLSLLLNQHGLIQERRELPLGPSPSVVRLSDIDADGDLDVICLARPGSSARLMVLENRGGATFASPLAIDPRRDLASLEAGDLDGDGIAELIACDPLGGQVLVVTSRGKPGDQLLLESSEFALGPSPTAACVLVTESGERLLAVAHATTPASVSLHGLGDGGLVPRGRIELEGSPVDLVAGAFAGSRGQHLALLARRQAGAMQGFVQVIEITPDGPRLASRIDVGLSASELVAGDLDGDGRDDLAISAQNTHNVNLILFTDGEPRRAPDLGAGLGCLGLAIGDLNQDGHADLVVANAFSHDLSSIYVLPAR
jgi:hypothetical protein